MAGETACFQCGFCGQSEFTVLFEGQDRMHGLPGQFEIVRCNHCRLVGLHPQPDDLAFYYPAEDYHAYQSRFNNIDSLRESVNRSLLKRAELLATLLPSDTPSPYLLDLGCGEGAFLRATNLAGPDKARRFGLDFSRAACLACRWPGQIEAGVSSLETVGFKSGQFDVVTMWHVLEHVRCPQQVLSEVKRLLKPTGHLIVACPVVDSLEARLFGRYWAGFDVPRHLYTYSRQSLEMMLQHCGFDCYEVKGLIAGWHSIKTSWQFLLGWGSAAQLLAKALAWPVFLIERIVFRNPSVAVFVAAPK